MKQTDIQTLLWEASQHGTMPQRQREIWGMFLLEMYRRGITNETIKVVRELYFKVLEEEPHNLPNQRIFPLLCCEQAKDKPACLQCDELEVARLHVRRNGHLNPIRRNVLEGMMPPG